MCFVGWLHSQISHRRRREPTTTRCHDRRWSVTAAWHQQLTARGTSVAGKAQATFEYYITLPLASVFLHADSHSRRIILRQFSTHNFCVNQFCINCRLILNVASKVLIVVLFSLDGFVSNMIKWRAEPQFYTLNSNAPMPSVNGYQIFDQLERVM